MPSHKSFQYKHAAIEKSKLVHFKKAIYRNKLKEEQKKREDEELKRKLAEEKLEEEKRKEALSLAKVEEVEEEPEHIDLEPEQRLEILESKLEDLREQKHKLFLLLKQILSEDERKKQEELAEKRRLEAIRMAEQQAQQQQQQETQSSFNSSPYPHSNNSSGSSYLNQHPKSVVPLRPFPSSQLLNRPPQNQSSYFNDSPVHSPTPSPSLTPRPVSSSPRMNDVKPGTPTPNSHSPHPMGRSFQTPPQYGTPPPHSPNFGLGYPTHSQPIMMLNRSYSGETNHNSYGSSSNYYHGYNQHNNPPYGGRPNMSLLPNRSMPPRMDDRRPPPQMQPRRYY